MNPVEQRLELMRGLQRDYAGCDKCDISVCTKYKAQSWGNPRSPHLFIIEETPSQEQVEQGTTQSSVSRQLLTAMLTALSNEGRKKIGATDFKAWVSNLTLCLPVYMNDQGQLEERAPTNEEIDNCMSRIYDEILLADPYVLVLFGALPYKHIGKMKAKFSSAIGEVITVRFTRRGIPYSYPAFVCPSMSTLLRTDAKARPDGPTYLSISILARAIQLAQFVEYMRNNPATPLDEVPIPPLLDASIDKTPSLTSTKKTRQR